MCDTTHLIKSLPINGSCGSPSESDAEPVHTYLLFFGMCPATQVLRADIVRFARPPNSEARRAIGPTEATYQVRIV
eukprot:scaffold722_cov255-Prasinococcus_capsulatus_cf.AAC.6